MKSKDLLKLLAAVAISSLVGLVGSIFTISEVPTWYTTLQKPVFNPPAWIFGPVWTTLYILMGISLWLVWKSDSDYKKRAILLFVVQLVLNAIWSPIFFGAHSLGGALAIIILLWAAIVLTILVFTKISKTAAWILVPYILWISFAVYLNLAIWLLN